VPWRQKAPPKGRPTSLGGLSETVDLLRLSGFARLVLGVSGLDVKDLATLVHQVLRLLETQERALAEFLDARDLLVPADLTDHVDHHGTGQFRHLLLHLPKTVQLVLVVVVLRLRLSGLQTGRVTTVVRGVQGGVVRDRLTRVVSLGVRGVTVRTDGRHDVGGDLEGTRQADLHAVRVHDGDDALGGDLRHDGLLSSRGNFPLSMSLAYSMAGAAHNYRCIVNLAPWRRARNVRFARNIEKAPYGAFPIIVMICSSVNLDAALRLYSSSLRVVHDAFLSAKPLRIAIARSNRGLEYTSFSESIR
jgi:hypothetical protein